MALRKPYRITIFLTKLASRENAKRVLGSVWAPFSGGSGTPSPVADSAESPIGEANRSVESPLAMSAADSSTLYSRRSAAGLGLNGVGMTRSGSGDSIGTKNTNSTVSSTQERLVAPVIVDASKPVCSGNGVSCSIILAEPVIFLKGLDHDGTIRDSSATSSAICRGRLQLNVTKSAKIKAVTLRFTGKARIEWPEGENSTLVCISRY